MVFKGAVTKMDLFALLWEQTLRPSLQMWKLGLRQSSYGCTEHWGQLDLEGRVWALSTPCCLCGVQGKGKGEVLVS